MKDIANFNVQYLIGKKYPLVYKSLPPKSKFFIHADKINGILMLCTADVNLNRIRVIVEKDIITKVNGIG